MSKTMFQIVDHFGHFWSMGYIFSPLHPSPTGLLLNIKQGGLYFWKLCTINSRQKKSKSSNIEKAEIVETAVRKVVLKPRSDRHSMDMMVTMTTLKKFGVYCAHLHNIKVNVLTQGNRSGSYRGCSLRWSPKIGKRCIGKGVCHVHMRTWVLTLLQPYSTVTPTLYVIRMNAIRYVERLLADIIWKGCYIWSIWPHTISSCFSSYIKM